MKQIYFKFISQNQELHLKVNLLSSYQMKKAANTNFGGFSIFRRCIAEHKHMKHDNNSFKKAII